MEILDQLVREKDKKERGRWATTIIVKCRAQAH